MIIPDFLERVDCGKDGLQKEFWPKLAPSEVVEVLQLLEDILGITPGRLRPTDRLDDMFRPAPTWNPIKWLAGQSVWGDGTLEVQEELYSRFIRANARVPEKLETLDELVRCWCKTSPETAKTEIEGPL